MNKYKIVNSHNKIQLETEISEMLKNGWKCKGGMTIQHSSLGPPMMFQTMIRKTVKTLL